MIDTIYYIDKTVGERLKSTALSGKEKLFFQDLISAYQHGYCYLCGNVESLDILSKTFEGYALPLKRYSEHGAVMNLVQQILVLTYKADKAALSEQIQDKAYFVEIPVAIDNEWRLDEKSYLLGENLEDCEFYELIVQKFHKEKEGVVCFQRGHGGGSTLSEVLKEAVANDKRLTLAFVDSDQKYGRTERYPNPSPAGGTASSARRASRKLSGDPQYPPHKLLQLDVHEVENLIPTQILLKLRSELPNASAGFDRLEELRKIKDGSPILYYDYKRGFPYIQDAPARAYWEEVLDELGGTEEEMPGEEKLEKDDYDPNDLFFMPIGGGKLLGHAIAAMKQPGWAIDGILAPIWKQIGADMLTWGFAAPPTYA